MDNRQISFKTSLNGFNKEDVINYIEQINKKYHKMESSYKEEIEQLKINTNVVDENSIEELKANYENQINQLKEENESLKNQLNEIKPDPYREKAELYDKMSSQLGSMIIMANEKADDIVDTANKKVDEAKKDVRLQIDSLNNKLYNEFIFAIESYTDEFGEFNILVNDALNTLNLKTEEIKQRFEKKNIELHQNLINDINDLRLFKIENKND